MTQFATEQELDGLFASEADLDSLFQFQAPPIDQPGDPLASIGQPAVSGGPDWREAMIQSAPTMPDIADQPFHRSAGGEVGSGLLRGLTIACECFAGVGEASGLANMSDML